MDDNEQKMTFVFILMIITLFMIMETMTTPDDKEDSDD